MGNRLLAAAAFVFVGVLQAAPLEHAGTIPMPGVKGRIDHFGVDLAGLRLFVAALGNDTVEVFDVRRDVHIGSLSGFGEPQGLLYVPATRRLFVANGSADRVDVLDGDSLKALKAVEKLADADNLRLDDARGKVVVGYGTGAIRFLDPLHGTTVQDIPLSGHPESFQIERKGARIFVNIRDADHVAVVDREKGRVVGKWSLEGARAHFPMALDESNGRLYVGARSPAVVVVYDTTTGKIAAKLPTCGDSDDLFYDAERKRLYVVCGEGKIEVFSKGSGAGLAREATLQTAPGARTGLFVPELRRLYVAAPSRGGNPARLLIFEVR